MALAGLEPARGYPQQILNLPRLPIPPQSLMGSVGEFYKRDVGVHKGEPPASEVAWAVRVLRFRWAEDHLREDELLHVQSIECPW